MKEELKAALMARFPELKTYQVEKVVDSYSGLMLDAIKDAILRAKYFDELTLPIDDLRLAAGRVTIQKKQHWVITLMQEHPSTSLVIKHAGGFKGLLTKCSINPTYLKAVMESINLEYELNPKRISDLNDEANRGVYVDMASLQSYYAKTQATYLAAMQDSQNVKPQYINALMNNLQIAKQLLESVQQTQDGTYFLAEKWEALDSGRQYGHGLSLQRIPKAVRHGALGHCHKYDFKASSFALMGGFAQALDPNLKIADLRDYVKDRASIRASIAAQLNMSEDWIKKTFTSLGFGATTNDNPFSSIRGDLGKDRFDALMANRQFQLIAQQTAQVRETILAAFPGDSFDFLGDLKYDAIDPKSNPASPKKRNKNQKLAWIYQALETTAANAFADIAKQHGYEPILWTHDCFYFKDKLPQSLVDGIAYALCKDFPWLQFEHEAVFPIHNGDQTSIFDQLDQEIEEHQRMIADEERKADTKQEAVDPLDMHTGYFADDIRALNGPVIRGLGMSIDLSKR